MLDWITNIANQFRRWVTSHGSDPLFWTALFLLGLVIFGITYRALNKHKQ